MVEDEQENADVGEPSPMSREEYVADWHKRAAEQEEIMAGLHDEKAQALSTPEQRHHTEQAQLKRQNAEHFRTQASKVGGSAEADWHKRAAEQEEEMAALHEERIQALTTPEQQHHIEQAQLRRQNAKYFRSQTGAAEEADQ